MLAFVDESGGKGQTRVYTMAAWIAPASQWHSFNLHWADCLSTQPPIAYFKMREAASLRGQFRAFSPAARDAKLRRLARVIRVHASAAITSSTDLQAFNDTIATAGKPFSDPYFWPFHITILAICLDLVERGHTAPADVVFDEHAIFGARAKLWYPLVRALMSDPADAAVMPEEPTFRSDADALPLQASDMLAWIVRRSCERNWDAVERWEITGSLGTPPASPGDFAWLVEEELGRVPMSSQVQSLTKRRMEGIMRLMEEHLQSGFKGVALPADFLKKYREVLSTSSRRK